MGVSAKARHGYAVGVMVTHCPDGGIVRARGRFRARVTGRGRIRVRVKIRLGLGADRPGMQASQSYPPDPTLPARMNPQVCQ